MSNIIQAWITERLGVIVDVESESFVHMIRNGHLIAALLHSFDIITEDQLTSVTSAGDDTNVLDRVQMWLRNIDVQMDDNTKNNIEQGKIASSIKLLYKMYLALKGKSKLHHITKQVESENVRPVDMRFEVKPVSENKKDPSDVGPHELSYPLTEYGHIIQWHKDRYAALIERCKRARDMYQTYIDDKFAKKDIPKTKRECHVTYEPTVDILPDADVESVNYTYGELLDQQIEAQAMELKDPDPKISKDIVKSIKKKNKKGLMESQMQLQMQEVLFYELWENILKKEENEFEMEVSKKMLKQSSFEKQMVTKLFEVRDQKDIMLENRLAVEDEIKKKRDEELLEQIFIKEKESGDDRYRYYFERDRALELHQRLYAEKLRLKVERECNMCRQIMQDIIDIALSFAEYKEAYDEDVPRNMRNDYAALFVAEKPIFDLIPETEVIIEFNPVGDEAENIYVEEIERQDAIDIRSFEDYCNYVWPWELQEHASEFIDNLNDIELAMNILGHIVFRLLLTKYPKPVLPPPPDIPKVIVAVSLKNVIDVTLLPVLSKLLAERQIQIIQLEDAINYCLEAYKQETTVEYPESEFVDETEEALKAASAKGKKDKGKQDEKSKGEKSQSKGKDKKKGGLGAESVIQLPPFQDVQLQTPKIYPCEEPVLSKEAELGRLAFEILSLGEALNDKILVKIFVEYLKSLTGIRGWVLVNFPLTFEQAVLLEEELTSKSVPRISSLQQIEDVPKSVSKVETTDHENDPNKHPTELKFCINEALVDPAKNETEGVIIEEIQGNEAPDIDKDTQWPSSEVQKNKSIIPCTEIVQCDSDCNCTKEELPNNIEDMADLEYRVVDENKPIDDKNAEFRVSKLLTNPDPVPPENDYDTYLTAFINIIQDGPEEVPKPYYVEEQLIENDLDIFYQNQGCFYSFYYKIFDLASIKHLAKLIVGDYTIPPKTSIQLFGDAILYLENDLNQEGPTPGKESKAEGKGKKQEKKEKEKPKADKGGGDVDKGKDKKDKGKDKKGDADKGKGKKVPEGAEVVIVNEDKATQMPEPEPELEPIYIPAIPAPLPGELNWMYFDLSIPEFFQIALATLWENVEEIYVCDFRELFFRKRLLWKAVVPYMTYVKHYMWDFIARPDDKQTHLYQFQKLYNEFDADMRDDEEFKAELHMRIYEFREKLWRICDDRMKEAEQERKNIVNQDWVTKQLCELTNIYITAMQLEIDRCIDTLQILTDYYTGIITKMPSQDDVLQKTLLNVINFNSDFEFEGSQAYSNYVQNMLKDVNLKPGKSPYNTLIDTNYDMASEAVLKTQSICLDALENLDAYFQPKGKKPKPKKDVKSKGKVEKKFPKFSEPEPDVKDAGPKLIEEWGTAINGEVFRVQLRLKLLKSVVYKDLEDAFNCSGKTFHGLYEDILQRYDREMKSVSEVCEIFSRAVEEEMTLQPELVLEADTFHINPNVLLFDDPLPEPEPPIKEYEREEAFSMEQLHDLVDILLDIAPNGTLPERAFIFLLQDIIVQDAEDGKQPMVPIFWRQITTKRMNQLSIDFFGKVEIVDWKDFIAYNCCIDFPSEDELMKTRWQFREHDPDSKEYVYSYQYDSVEFWFEKQFDKNDPPEMYRLNKLKQLLYKMYKINEDMVNYTALLLTFCKDENPVVGVAKALLLSLGKFVCWQEDIGESFKNHVRQIKIEQALEEEEKMEAVDEVIDTLVNTTVHRCESCYLEDYVPEELYHDEVINQEVEYLEQIMKEQYPNVIDEYNYEYSSSYYEENYSETFLQEAFSNCEIGFEANAIPPKVYHLFYEVILTVMMAAMPWYAKVQNIADMSLRQKLEIAFESSRSPEFENVVFMHEFLNSELFNNLLQNNLKFVVIKPIEIISKLVKDV